MCDYGVLYSCMRHVAVLASLGVFLVSSVLCGEDPLSLKPTDDTFLSVEHTGAPAGRGERNEFQIYGQPKKNQFRALLKFDLSEVKAPPAAAILRLYAWNCGSPKKSELIRCHAVVRDWSEKSASWDMCLEADQWVNPGGDWDPTPVSGFLVNTNMGGEKGYWLDFDVTALVQAWVLKRRPNFGMVLMFDPDCTAEIRCRSKENGANGPELKLAWNAKLDRGPGMVMGDKIKPYGDPVKMEPVWTTLSLTVVKVGTAFSQKIGAKGGVRPYKFSAGTLPEGVKFSEDGVLSGTPVKEGKFPVQLVCTDGAGKKVTKSFELTVQAANAAAAVADAKDKEQGKDKKESVVKKAGKVDEE